MCRAAGADPLKLITGPATLLQGVKLLMNPSFVVETGSTWPPALTHTSGKTHSSER
jgi:hypothetical protein